MKSAVRRSPMSKLYRRGAANEPRDAKMEVATIREAVAVFDEPESLEGAMSDLQSNGVDRADLSILAPPSLAAALGEGPPGLSNLAPRREAAVSDTDLRQGRVLGTGLAAMIAGFAAAGVSVATGGVATAAIAAAAAAGGVGLVGTLIGRVLAEEHSSFLDAHLDAGGVLLWVRIGDVEAQRSVLDVLHRYSNRVSIHDRPAAGAPRHIGRDSELLRTSD
jgi:hypothetical protein